MCGIAGVWGPAEGIGQVELERMAITMARAIAHRGPDHQASWADARCGIALGHARLSIIDLSDAANQPMRTVGDRYAIVFNGEIYNFAELAQELRAAGYAFASRGDTEVIPAAVDHWGIERAVQRMNGIFAFALFDRTQRILHLVRDHVGVKPLYFGVQGGELLFASTLRAFLAHPRFRGDIDSAALAAYVRFSYVPAPLSIFRDVVKLDPGCIATIDAGLNVRSTRYWNLVEQARAGQADPLRASEPEVAEAFESLAADAVRSQLVSDVPLGAFLSGGIDSSLVAALMQRAVPGNVRTFTIGFEDARFDESANAREVAKHIGTRHTEMTCTTREAQAIVPQIPTYFDEPFADSSQVPTMLLSRLTRQHVTVALSGDGGDELFAGYDRYYWMDRLRTIERRLPQAAARSLAALTRAVPRERSFPVIRRLLPSPQRWLVRVDRFYHYARMLARFDDYAYLYRTTPMSVVTMRDAPLLSHETEPASLFDDSDLRRGFPDLVDWMQLLDQKTYLVDDILQKVDRASMAYGLEARVPLLDRRLVEFSWRVPQSMKIERGTGKRLMRRVLGRYLPSELIERPKRGFSVPLGDWLRNELRGWAESLLTPTLLECDGLLDAAAVRRCWSAFCTGEADHTQGTVWALLMFLAWREHYAR